MRIVLNNRKDLLTDFFVTRIYYIINGCLKSGMSLSMKSSLIQEILVAITA